MSSAVGFTPKAQREFSAFETSVQELILDYLDILAEDPVRRSERGGSAHAGHQIYRFPGASDASISLAFQYTQDETTLVITGIEIEFA